MYYVYILTNKNNDVLYIGVTNDLRRRIKEHKEGIVQGFTSKYNVKKLVWFTEFPDIKSAIIREKQLKKWNHAWKERLINETNPHWDDLYDDLW